MILSGNEIIKMVKKKKIVIEPFTEKQVNPNSYNYRLGNYYRTVEQGDNSRQIISAMMKIPEDGLQLNPNRLYLSTTKEIIGSDYFVTSLIGRSSVGRMGLFVQYSADLGNLGQAHSWTLELKCVQPVIIYPNMIIGQVSFWKPKGNVFLYNGKYAVFNTPEGRQEL